MGSDITIYDIAREAGVSITTVSRVLREQGNVSQSTRERVEEVIARRNYRPSAIARGMPSQKTNTLGIVLPNLLNPHYAMIFTGASEEARRNGYAISLFPWNGRFHQGPNPVTLLTERLLDGVIVLVEYLEPEQQKMLVSSLKELRHFMPVALIGRVSGLPHFPSIYHNMAALMRHLVSRLVGMGHKRIAFIGGAGEDRDEFRRDVGYFQGLEEAGLPRDPALRVYCPGSAPAGEEALDRLLSGLPRGKWPTAVIALNDLAAMGCMTAARRHGLNLPGDLAIVGCDDLFFAPHLSPALTTVNLRQEWLGSRAVQLLLSGEERQEEAGWEVVLRDSCRDIRA